MATTPSTYTPTRWSLDDLFSRHDAPEMEAAFEQLNEKVAAFEQVRAELSPQISEERFMELVHELDAITRLAYRVYGYASLWFNEDTQNQAAQTFMARVRQFMAELQNRTLFFELWWKGLDKESARPLVKASGDYAYWLETMRRFQPYTLSEAEEKIINIKDVTGSDALQTLYDTITNRYAFTLVVDGEEHELTRDALMAHVQGPDADLRARAYQELYRVYGEDGTILGQIYHSLVRDWRNEQVDLRGFDQPIAARNLANDIPDEVVDTLLRVSADNAPLFQRYFRLKARWLGIERLRRYDVYAPVARSDKRFEYDTAVDMVLDSFAEFEPRIAELARRIFEEDHMDSEVRKGKSSGAFCSTVVPELTPWVLMNYQGRPRDVATMAHELGHGVHSMLADHHTVFTQHASLPLAETASTFGEMLLIDRMLEEEPDASVRRDILFRQVDDAYATIMRQVFFARFERRAHAMVHEGASVDELAEAYVENLETQFGDALALSDEFRWEWVSIPHIYQVPFYVYAYAFGQLLVLSLYQQYREEGESFKPRYLGILSAGGSKAPEQVLQEAGVAIRDAAFWQGGFDVIEGLIEQLEALPVESAPA